MSSLGAVARSLTVCVLSRAQKAAVVLYACAIVAVLAYPKLARRTFVDENAFLVGATRGMFDVKDAHAASDSARILRDVAGSTRTQTTAKRMEWITQALDARGFESYASPTFDGGMNTHAIARATRGDGRECMVLLTSLGVMDVDAEAVTIGLALRVFETVGRADWLAKDLIWVAIDGEHGDIEATMAWLKRYYSPSEVSHGGTREAFERAGTIQQAFAFSAPHGASASKLLVQLEGWNGAYPNQDIFTMFDKVNQISRARLPLILDADMRTRKTKRVWSASARHFDMLESAIMFMWRAATGIPSGPHAAFKAHSIDALGIHALTQKGIRTVEGIDAYHYFGSLLENSLRACNNLLELLHHSCFYYIMLGPDRFLGIAEYIAPQVMLLVSLTLVAAQLTTYGAGKITDAPSSDVQMRTSHDWFSAIRRLLLALATGLAAGSLCTAANAHDIGHAYVTIVVTVFMIVASVAFLRLTRADESNRPSKTASAVTNGVMIVHQDDWVADKVINIAWLLAVMSACTFFNFSLALFSTFALAPACVLCSPAKDAKLAVVALTALPIASLIVVAHVGGFSITHAFGLLASHHARWHTFALPIVFGIAYPTTLMAMRVASSPTKQEHVEHIKVE